MKQDAVTGRIHLVECPRDAMQGWKKFIPTQNKIDYINALMQVGFDTLDFGSFVSASAIPQMADTSEVVPHIIPGNSETRLLAIVANARGATEACAFDQITDLGYPFSISETFQQRNANSSIAASVLRVEEIQQICARHNKQLVIYISMAFGNPYGDSYSAEIVFEWANKMAAMDVKTISLADTVGLATPEQVFTITSYLVNQLPDRQVGVHLHSTHVNWKEKIDAAINAGCRRFDGALKGIGGCPMANDELVGNMDSELMIPYFQSAGLLSDLNQEALRNAMRMASEIFA